MAYELILKPLKVQPAYLVIDIQLLQINESID